VRRAPQALVALLVTTAAAQAFSTASVRFYGTGGTTTVDRIKVPVDPPAPADVGGGDFTVELWLKGTRADNDTPTTGYRADGDAEDASIDWIYGNIIADRDIFGPGPDWGVSIHRDGPLDDRAVLRFGTENGPPDFTQHTLQGSTDVLDGDWHHVAFVRERASGHKRIYVDGVLDVSSAAGASSGDLAYPNGRATSYPDSDPFLVFAAEKHGFDATSGSPSFSGLIDEIRVWSVARSAAEIAQARSQSLPGTTPGLALYLRLDEGSGQSLGDATGGNTATLFAGTPGNGEWSTDNPTGSTATTTTTLPELLGGRRLLLRGRASAPSERYLFVLSRDANLDLGDGNGSPDDPTAGGGSLGGTVRVRTASGDDVYTLPAARWSLVGQRGADKGYRYKDKATASGPIRTMVVKPGLVQVSGRGAALGHELEVDPQPVDVVLRLGQKQFCLRFGGEITFAPGARFLARSAPAPSSCPP
jgi:hypothetical protein